MTCKIHLKYILLSLFIAVISLGLSAQKTDFQPSHITKAVFFSKTIPLRDMSKTEFLIPEDEQGSVRVEVPEIMDKPDFSKSNVFTENNFDAAMQYSETFRAADSIIVNTEGVGNLQNVLPPDTEGDVGNDYYVQMVNMSMAVYNKQGDIVLGPVSNLSIWQNAPEPWSGYSNGDPIVLYDEEAGRWLISELSFPNHPYSPHYEKIAISETSDPTGAWYLYGFEYDYFCDYPKLSVWHDAYLMTTNNNYWDGSQWRFHAVGVSVFERDSMLAGSPNARRIFFDLYPNQEPWSMLPADFDGKPPSSDTPAYLAYYKEAYPDRIMIYEASTHWENPLLSTLTLSQTIYPEAFSGSLPNGISQPDDAPYLASMSNRLMYRLQYRNFDSLQCMVANHTVNCGDGVAGIRWYEFRNEDNGWDIFQQGTWSPDNTHRWMGSVAMDGYGNIALGYSASDTSTYPSIRFTGRLKEDPPGLMSIEEQEIISGSGVQMNYNHRWGDYSCMSVDPLNNTSFWYTQQYYAITGNRSWQTRIAAFNLIDELSLDITADSDTVCPNQEISLYALPGGGNQNYYYSWTSNPPGFQSNEQNPVISTDTSSWYYCTLSDSVNSVNDSIKIIVDPCMEIVTIITQKPELIISPVPADNYFSVNLSNAKGKDCWLKIIGVTGNILFSRKYNKPEIASKWIDIEFLKPGIYFVETANGFFSVRGSLIVH